jgi:ferredoxin
VIQALIDQKKVTQGLKRRCPMKQHRKIIRIDEDLCNGCGQCVPSCAEGALAIVDGKARVIADKYCDGLGACLGECPTGALKIIEREADAFDENAVEQMLKQKKFQEKNLGCGCPSSKMQTFTPGSTLKGVTAQESSLSHWPVQIRLIPPHAPFLNNADLLVTADCVPVALPGFHERFLAGKVVLIGCPKFDNAEEYYHKFREIFEKADVRSVLVLSMEVPCCTGLPALVAKAIADSGKNIPVSQQVVGLRGELLAQRPLFG